jgi:hypothetical protein
MLLNIYQKVSKVLKNSYLLKVFIACAANWQLVYPIDITVASSAKNLRSLLICLQGQLVQPVAAVATVVQNSQPTVLQPTTTIQAHQVDTNVTKFISFVIDAVVQYFKLEQIRN